MIFGSGAFWFGVVIGYITYRTLRHKAQSGISDIASVIGAVGGGAILKSFPSGTSSFDEYGFGLAAGFFVYLILSLAIAGWFTKQQGSTQKGGKAANEFLGD